MVSTQLRQNTITSSIDTTWQTYFTEFVEVALSQKSATYQLGITNVDYRMVPAKVLSSQESGAAALCQGVFHVVLYRRSSLNL